MSKICQITGKKAMVGNNVSHSKHRMKCSFDMNLFDGYKTIQTKGRLKRQIVF